MGAKKEKKNGDLRFKAGLDRLEQVIRGLEGDELELEDAIERYEEGLKLFRHLTGILLDAEKRVEVLRGEKGGELLWERFTRTAPGDEA